ncbi:DUF6191 domain-containing protein [Kitasatospora sp. NPDC088346]|uniref:DUF6191 domain-containing protein n=1 Tax=Kitasatospora sp. NPDC088346 TaxID=3364073 RepID=UPI0037F95722
MRRAGAAPAPSASPGPVCAPVAVAFVDRPALRASRVWWVPWRGTGRGGWISATGFERLHARFAAGEQHALDRRRSTLMRRDEEGEGAPPRTRVDPAAGTAVVRPPGDRADRTTGGAASILGADGSVGPGSGTS